MLSVCFTLIVASSRLSLCRTYIHTYSTYINVFSINIQFSVFSVISHCHRCVCLIHHENEILIDVEKSQCAFEIAEPVSKVPKAHDGDTSSAHFSKLGKLSILGRKSTLKF